MPTAPPPPPPPPPPPYHPAPSYKQPAYADVPPKYEYAYAVKDDYASVDFNANEARDGYATNGGYTVALPDGRIQTVTYTVTDGYSGYVADVSYTGEARYDDPKPYHPAPKPAYHPAPSYRPRPAYPAPHA